MKYIQTLSVVLLIVILSSCSGFNIQNESSQLSGKKPPRTQVQIDNKTYDTTLGAYCWGNTCVDTAGPVELLEDKAPIDVQAGEEITIDIKYKIETDEVHLMQIQGDEEVERTVTNHQFPAPEEEGIYYYSYGVWWMDDDEAYSLGDAFYAFALKVGPLNQ